MSQVDHTTTTWRRPSHSPLADWRLVTVAGAEVNVVLAQPSACKHVVVVQPTNGLQRDFITSLGHNKHRLGPQHVNLWDRMHEREVLP